MVIFKQADDVQQYLSQADRAVGYIPTMGALHAGHSSLITQARNDGRLTVCSIYVNPTQFNDPEDYKLYPITVEADTKLLLEADCDVLFLPDTHTIYPFGTEMARAYDFGALESILEGAHRPGHFRGVGQVVSRLLEIIRPDFLYMGQKDYQQCMVIGQLIKMMDIPTQLIVCPTVREADGLALSSRNRRLTDPQRTLSSIIYQCLVSIATKADTGTWGIVQKECLELLRQKGFEPEYVALADCESLQELSEYDPKRKMVALIAARMGKVRLIDNMLIG